MVFAVLIAMATVIYSFPQAMLSPGSLIPEHQEVASDCFACHSPFQGPTSSRCTTCHKTDDIGLKTTEGQLIPKQSIKMPFHEHLQENDCVTCHSEHEGVMAFRPATVFDHNFLDPLQQNQCRNCHNTPTDSMHLTFEDNCLDCHDLKAWTPASFDHEQWFRFDKHHKPECENCHITKDFSSYTCTSCHEHSPAKIRNEHLEEGIFQFENCAECHRSGDEDESVMPQKTYGNKKAQKRRYKYEHRERERYHEHDDYEEENDDDEDD
jgi:hypothetical protein